jgi:hypothetical protein
MGSAIIAAVGRHGRESHALVQGCALMCSLSLAPQLPPPSVPYQDLARDLVAKIATVVAPGQSVHVAWVENETEEAPVAQLLKARGVRVVNGLDAAVSVTVECSQNLRERVCAAEVRQGGRSDIVVVTRPLDADASADRGTPLALEVRPLFVQRAPILDVAVAGDPTAVTEYRRVENGWQRQGARSISTSRVWPRDVRGRLRMEAATLEVFLPGAGCRATLNPFNMTCADEPQPWPIGIENSGVMPARNYFTTPEGKAFYGSATLGPEADARWLLVGQERRLVFLDGDRRAVEPGTGATPTVSAEPHEPDEPGETDEIAGLATVCGPGTYVILGSRVNAGNGTSALHLFRVAARRLIPAASPVPLPGTLTALWATEEARAATAVSRNLDTGRYEAFQVDISCTR